jgi:hypothetical protein
LFSPFLNAAVDPRFVFSFPLSFLGCPNGLLSALARLEPKARHPHDLFLPPLYGGLHSTGFIASVSLALAAVVFPRTRWRGAMQPTCQAGATMLLKRKGWLSTAVTELDRHRAAITVKANLTASG